MAQDGVNTFYREPRHMRYFVGHFENKTTIRIAARSNLEAGHILFAEQFVRENGKPLSITDDGEAYEPWQKQWGKKDLIKPVRVRKKLQPFSFEDDKHYTLERYK